jgi:hypothetical protein
MKRKITRTWITKSGITKTKTYIYEGRGKSRRGLTLVGKNGKVNKKNVDKFKDEIRADSSLTTAEKYGLIKDVDILVKTRAVNGKKLTTSGFYGKQIGATKDPQLNKIKNIERLLANAGYSAEEAAEELDIDESDILDASNWMGDIFNFAGASYQVKFTYTGSLFTRI